MVKNLPAFRDLGLLLEHNGGAEMWHTFNLTDFSEDNYAGVMATVDNGTSSSLGLRNCSLEEELDDAAQGTGLAFIVMADVFTKLPAAPVWSFLFFAMLLYVDTQAELFFV